jgi:ABC-type protease/lipase transport system fused ATPase/permease subunit
VALARALHAAPRIVVLDEPNAHLDSDGEQALGRTLIGLRAAGTTVVLITQRTPVLALVDRILVMRDGSIERIGMRQAGADAATADAAVPVLKPMRS